MKKYLLLASLPFIILEQSGVTSFSVSRCAFRGDAKNVEISKRMSLMIRSPFTHSVVTSTITRHMSLDNDEFMASLSGDVMEANNRNIDPRMEQDPGNKSTQSRMFQRLMQAKQDGIPGMPPAPRRSPADQQQQQQQQQIMNSQAAAPASANPYYPPQDTANTNPYNNPYAAAYPPPPPYGYNPYYPPPVIPQGQDSTFEQQQQYMNWVMQQQQFQNYPPPAYYPPQPMPEGGMSQVPPPSYYPPPPYGYPGYYPPPQQAFQPQQQFPSQQQAQQQPQLPIAAPPSPPMNERIEANTAKGSVESRADPNTKPTYNMQRRADKIANTSDLYLETLKIDTATRQRARDRGDDEEANAVFQDPRIDQLKDSLQPYFEQSSAQLMAASQDLATKANNEEMKLRYAQQLQKKEEDDKEEENRNNPSNTGVSYREMMKQKVLFNKQSSNQQENILDATIQEVNNSAVEDDSNARAKIRTLMGFLMKHRGGTNFGSGRLKRPEEIAKYENVLNEVMDILKRETAWENNIAVTPLLKKGEEDTTLNNNKDIASSLACVEAVISAYKRTPSSSMLLSLKDALLHAAQTCSAVETVEVPQTSVPISVLPIAEPLQKAEVTTLPKKETIVAVKNNIIEENIENRRVLEKAFLVMEKIAGDDKYGIKTGLSIQEAADAAETLEAMRRVLMEELNCA